MTTTEVADQIETFVRNQFRVAVGDTRFSRTQPLFDLGYIDSVGVVELLAFLDDRFGIQLPDDVLMSDEFATIDGMATIVCRLGSGQPPR